MSASLYIIGNGFDLHHSLPTSYGDYRKFLQGRHPEFVDRVDEMFYMNGATFFVLDVENTAVEDYVGFDAHAARALGRNEGCATAGAAGHGDSATPFPNPHADLGGRRSRSGDHLGKFNVATVGELFIHF